ncbi:MAG: hypothetical protein JSV88_11815 [Candidatus Aminicenantes bacterium]|nr:MAG: hypothetical protein JSV88_11815 [Candidatus Aminicenantes bacterium]
MNEEKDYFTELETLMKVDKVNLMITAKLEESKMMCSSGVFWVPGKNEPGKNEE